MSEILTVCIQLRLKKGLNTALFSFRVFKEAVIDNDGKYYWSAAFHYAANDSLSSFIENKCRRKVENLGVQKHWRNKTRLLLNNNLYK